MSNNSTKEREEEKKVKGKRDDGVYCPDCGAKLSHSEGCIFCPFCGWSTCS